MKKKPTKKEKSCTEIFKHIKIKSFEIIEIIEMIEPIIKLAIRLGIDVGYALARTKPYPRKKVDAMGTKLLNGEMSFVEFADALRSIYEGGEVRDETTKKKFKRM
jgi:hypothetical protein